MSRNKKSQAKVTVGAENGFQFEMYDQFSFANLPNVKITLIVVKFSACFYRNFYASAFLSV